MPTYKPHLYNVLCSYVTTLTPQQHSACLRALHDSPEQWCPPLSHMPESGGTISVSFAC